MTKFVSLCAAIMVVLVVSACGSSGGGSDPIPAQPTVVATPVADVTFTNVPTSVSKQQVIQGQRNVELTAFRMDWKDQSRPTISQMVFTSQSTDSLWAVFKDFKLVDNNGNDIKSEALYDVRRDDAKHEVTINFYQASWYPNDFGIVPKTYSLLGSLDPAVPIGTTSTFKLTAVQLHEAGKTAAFDVSGVRFEVVKIAGMGLPVITTASTFQVNVAADQLGSFIAVGTFNATCPAENTAACTLMEVGYFAQGMFEPVLVVDGIFFGSTRGTFPDDVNSFHSSIGITIFPGETKTYVVMDTVVQPTAFITLNTVWMVGQTKVNPIIPTGQDSCVLIVSDTNGCKG